MAERRLLTEAEKADVRSRFASTCYICGMTLDGYDPSEIEYDHIYAYADGYSQDISNFAPIHASRSQDRLNCHAAKGRKSPYEYKEELRIRKEMEGIRGLRDLCPAAKPLDIEADFQHRQVRVGTSIVPLYTQRLDGVDHWYFFHEISVRNIENDDKIQLRPLEDKIYPLISSLRHSVQLLPSLGRLDLEERKVRIFDGQHKAVAQIVGNKRESIPCIVFLNPDVDALRVTVFEAHTTFLQQRYKRSHIDDKLAVIYAERIADFRSAVGNALAPYTERDILRHDSRAQVRQFIRASIIAELKNSHDFVDRYVAIDRNEQRGPQAKPMIWQSLERFVDTLCLVEPVDKPSDDPLNYREEELDNTRFILDCIEESLVRGKWNASVPDSEQHKLSRNYFYEKTFGVWLNRLAYAMRHAYDLMRGRAAAAPLCYQEPYSPEMKHLFRRIFERLATHGVWLNPAAQPVIAGAYENQIEELFNSHGLDWVYLTKLE